MGMCRAWFNKVRHRVAERGVKRFLRDVLCTAIAEFLITMLYALVSIFIGILAIGVQADKSWNFALSSNVLQGEVIIASVALMGPLAYSVVANPPIKFKSVFQFLVSLYTLLAVVIYTVVKLDFDIDANSMVCISVVALVFALVLNFVSLILEHSSKDPADKMRNSTLSKAASYAEYARGRK